MGPYHESIISVSHPNFQSESSTKTLSSILNLPETLLKSYENNMNRIRSSIGLKKLPFYFVVHYCSSKRERLASNYIKA